MPTSKPENKKGSNPKLAGAINACLTEGRLPCPQAFKVAQDLDVVLIEVGKQADQMGIKISNCQLGCFGKDKATQEQLAVFQVVPAVSEAITTLLTDGKIQCKTAHEVAKNLKVNRRKVGDTASKLNIKVSDCQLGCF